MNDDPLMQRLHAGLADSEAATLEEAAETLRFRLQWVAACAAFPVLRWPLTAYLGDHVRQALGRAQPITEADHWAVARLQWFRLGFMDEATRQALIVTLERPVVKAVRIALERAFDTVSAPGEGLVSIGAAVGDAGTATRDPVLAEFMTSGVRTRLEHHLARALADAFGLRRAGRYLREGALIAVASILSIALYVVIGSSLNAWMRETVAAETPFSMKMVALPGGRFVMGSPEGKAGLENDAGPQHEVEVPAFAIGIHEVTFDQWTACVDDGGCGGYSPNDSGWGRGSRPVINVSWEDAQEYVTWLSLRTGNEYRLPSESEWEYAARGGTGTAYPWGNDWDPERANGDSSVGGTTEVGSYPPNEYGLFDTHGNVFEWAEDVYVESVMDAPTDGSPRVSGKQTDRRSSRVLRGGSWINDPRNLRSAFRTGDFPEPRYNNIGFRVARTLP